MTDHKNDFSRWWWPVNWPRIVYLVWVDQMGYWRHLRPHLSNRRLRKRIWIQAMLGTFIVTLALSLVPIYVLEAVETQAGWNMMLYSTVVGLVIGTVFVTYRSKANVIIDVVLVGMYVGLASCLNFGLCLGFKGNTKWGLTEGAGLGLSIGVALGVGHGVRQGIIRGRDSNFDQFFLVMLLAAATAASSADGDAFEFVGYISATVVSIVTLVGGVYLGSRWATRQLPDGEAWESLMDSA